MTTDKVTIYRARTVIDGSGGEPRRNASVIVRGDQIVDITTEGSNAADEIVDLGNATLLPGLVDAHVHFVWNAGGIPHEEIILDADPSRTVLRMAGRARSTLLAGTTTVRDLGATDSLSIPLAAAIDAGELPGPRILAAGRAIAMTGGHAYQIASEADGPDGIRAAVREEIKRGATAVKFMASGGVYDRNAELHDPQLTPEELRAGVEETHKAGLVAAAHAYTPNVINLALDAGVNTIEHGSFMDEATARRMKDEGQWWVPTMMAADLIVRRADETGAPEYMRRKGAMVRDAVREGLRMALQIGTPIAGGTDSGGAGIGHGRLPYEAGLMVECGAEPVQAISMCTSGSATAIGRGESLGRLLPGYHADLLAVKGDAAEDISRLDEVLLVVKDGRRVR